MANLPPALIRSIPWDQGTEMARHITITTDLGAAIYFCDSHSPWQRGSNENANGLLRQFFPEGTDLSVRPSEHLRAVEEEINNRPRLILHDHLPADLFAKLRASNIVTLARNHRVSSAQFSGVIDRIMPTPCPTVLRGRSGSTTRRRKRAWHNLRSRRRTPAPSPARHARRNRRSRCSP